MPTTKLTITEALAEMKTISKRVAKKRDAVMGVLLRQEAYKDPMGDEGGSLKFIHGERQAIADLEERAVAIRLAINRVNAAEPLSIAGATRTIAGWLVWRREVADGQKGFLSAMRAKIEQMRGEALKRGYAVTADPAQAKASTDLIVNVSEKKLLTEIEEMERVLGELDGMLSLKNATVMVEV